MKKILLKFLAPEIKSLVYLAAEKEKQEEKIRRLDFKLIEYETLYPLGGRLIARSNEDDPLLIGVVLSYERIHDTWFIWIRNEKTHERFLVGNQIIRPYSEDLFVALNKLTAKEQWNVMAKNYFL